MASAPSVFRAFVNIGTPTKIVKLAIEIKRFTIEESNAFFARWRVTEAVAERMKAIENKAAANELSDEDFAKRIEARAKIDADDMDFLKDSMARFVTVPSGELNEDDDPSKPITTGTDLLRVYAGKAHVLSAIMRSIFVENRMTEEQKKELQSQSDSPSSSKESIAIPDGDAPAATADPVVPTDTAASAPASDHQPIA